MKYFFPHSLFSSYEQNYRRETSYSSFCNLNISNQQKPKIMQSNIFRTARFTGPLSGVFDGTLILRFQSIWYLLVKKQYQTPFTMLLAFVDGKIKGPLLNRLQKHILSSYEDQKIVESIKLFCEKENYSREDMEAYFRTKSNSFGEVLDKYNKSKTLIDTSAKH